MTEEKRKFTEKELEALFEKAGKHGAILALLHFDSFGKEKEDVSASLVELISRINAEKGVLYCRGEIEEVLESENDKGKSYSTFTEVKVLFASLDIAISICLRYGPITIEILEPKELKLNSEALQGTLLNASSVGQQFSSFFMNKLLKDGDLAEFQENLKKRVEHGKKLLADKK